MAGLLVNCELERKWKEVVLVWSKLLFRNLSWGTEENRETSVWIAEPRFEPGISWIRTNGANYSVVTFCLQMFNWWWFCKDQERYALVSYMIFCSMKCAAHRVRPLAEYLCYVRMHLLWKWGALMEGNSIEDMCDAIWGERFSLKLRTTARPDKSNCNLQWSVLMHTCH
jgi:hypothetical protein